MNILNPKFKYTPSLHTDVSQTLRRFGFKPTTEAERKARQEKKSAEVLPIKRTAKG